MNHPRAREVKVTERMALPELAAVFAKVNQSANPELAVLGGRISYTAGAHTVQMDQLTLCPRAVPSQNFEIVLVVLVGNVYPIPPASSAAVPRMDQANVLPTFDDIRNGGTLSKRVTPPKVQICTKGLTILVWLAFWPVFRPAARLLSGHALLVLAFVAR